MTQLKYSLFRTQNQCHSWLDQESGGPKNSWMPDQVRHDTVEVFFVPYTESMSFLACPGIQGDCQRTLDDQVRLAQESRMPDQVRHDTVEVFFVPYTESMSFLACPGIQGDCQRTPGCLIKSGMTQLKNLKYSLFRTQNQCHSWLDQESRGTAKELPDA